MDPGRSPSTWPRCRSGAAEGGTVGGSGALGDAGIAPVGSPGCGGVFVACWLVGVLGVKVWLVKVKVKVEVKVVKVKVEVKDVKVHVEVKIRVEAKVKVKVGWVSPLLFRICKMLITVHVLSCLHVLAGVHFFVAIVEV